MRNIILSTAIVLTSILSAGQAFAQVSADAFASATITTPQALEKSSDLEIHTTFAQSGRKAMDQNVAAQDVKPATFTISGTPGMAYGVMAPEAMNVAAATRNISIHTSLSGAFRLASDGTDKVSISARFSTASAAVNTPVGGGLDVTVVYN